MQQQRPHKNNCSCQHLRQGHWDTHTYCQLPSTEWVAQPQPAHCQGHTDKTDYITQMYCLLTLQHLFSSKDKAKPELLLFCFNKHTWAMMWLEVQPAEDTRRNAVTCLWVRLWQPRVPRNKRQAKVSQGTDGFWHYEPGKNLTTRNKVNLSFPCSIWSWFKYLGSDVYLKRSPPISFNYYVSVLILDWVRQRVNGRVEGWVYISILLWLHWQMHAATCRYLQSQESCPQQQWCQCDHWLL